MDAVLTLRLPNAVARGAETGLKSLGTRERRRRRSKQLVCSTFALPGLNSQTGIARASEPINDVVQASRMPDVQCLQAGRNAVHSEMEQFVEGEAASGKVVCTSRGCRPAVLDGDTSGALPEYDWGNTDGDHVFQSRISTYWSRSTARDLSSRGPMPHFFLDFAEYLNEVWMETAAADKYFSAALAADPDDLRLLLEYAQFCWRALLDPQKADTLFNLALAKAPDDPHILAVYAHFLWQCDE